MAFLPLFFLPLVKLQKKKKKSQYVNISTISSQMDFMYSQVSLHFLQTNVNVAFIEKSIIGTMLDFEVTEL